MKAPREDMQRKVREWLAFADEDLQLARGAMNMPGREVLLTGSLPTMLSSAQRST